MWRVRLLGGLGAESQDGTIHRFRTRRVGLLLAYLAYYRDQNHSREQLADLLWPDLDPEKGKRNLRQALFSLRSHLEPPGVPAGAALDTQQSWVRLNPLTVTSDVDEFRQAIKNGNFPAAVEQYRGDLLPGFYEDWVQTERLRLEDEYVGAVETCLRLAENEGGLDDAIRYARLAIAKDDLREEFHTSLIRLYLAVGRPSSAASHLDEWRTRSESELGLAPDPELSRAIEAARRAPAPRPSPANIEAPPPEETPAPTVRLPIQLTRFFGRDAERAYAIESLLNHTIRLITLTGPAGTGKTRLSVEAGRILAESHGWNVWFIPLADISEGAGLLDATLAAMRLQGDPLEALSGRLSDGRNLLILDNLEHIVEEAAPQVASILKDVPNVSLLVTSRQTLRIEGEHEIDLATLPVPTEEEFAEVAEAPSVRLFVDRARAALPDFTLTTNNAATIGEICRKLDGLPLALEIAAGLVGAFSPGQLLQNLEGRLELLRSRRRDLSSRHRSLRAAIDYSYNLLDESLQAFFVRLSVFRGGFTVEAAGEVCLDAAPLRKGERLRRILDLQERSLLRAEEVREGSPARFRLLESYREYGAELLNPETERAYRRRHAQYFLNQPPTPEDRDNRLAAVRFLYEDGAISECVTMLLSFGSFSSVADDLVRSLARSAGFDAFSPFDQTRILRLATDSHIHRSDFAEAYRTSLRACEIAEKAGLEEELSIGHRKLSLALAYLGRREESIAQSEANLREGQLKGDLAAIEMAYTNIGTNSWSLGDFKAARRAHEGALAASLELRNGRPYWPILYNLSLSLLDQGLLDDGFEFANEGLRIAQADEEAFGVSMCLALVSRYHRYRGNLPGALSTSYESLIRRRKAGFLYWTFQAIYAHALILLEMKRYPEATALLAASRSVEKVNRREYTEVLDRVHAEFTGVEYERAWADGLAMSLDQAYRRATSFR